MTTIGVVHTSVSPFASPVILVKRRDSGWRFCVNYRVLNRVTIPNKFPMLTINELLYELVGVVIFSKLDSKSEYHQIHVREDAEKTAFRMHVGHYEFLMLLFGLSNALVMF